MRKNYDYVIVGLQPWYTSIGSNCKNIATELSINSRVLYINSPLDRRTVLKRKSDKNIARHREIIQNKENPVQQIGPNFWVYYPQHILESVNWIPFTFLFEIFNRMNNRRFAADIRNATQILGFKDYIIFNDNELYRTLYFKKLLKPLLYIYYCRDYLRSVDYWKKHGNTIEPKHICLADLALANSAYLHQYLLQHNPNSYYVGQGCDTALFDHKKTHPEPADMAPVAHPRIGYIGVLTSMRLDVECLLNIARQKPAWQIVLVGPEDEVFRKSELHQLSNVHFLGKKSLNELPAYIEAFDVCLNPQLVNELTIGNYPLKIDEYLNLGKPVVATKTLTMKLFNEHVYLAEKGEDYPALIQKAMDENSAEMEKNRINFAAKHTWKNSVKLITDAVDKSLEKK